MEKNTSSVGIALVSLITGLLIGRMTATPTASYMDMHRMPEGTMMPNMGDQAPQSMQHTMDSMTAALKDKTGTAFDLAFLDEMIVHHKGAVDMARLVLERSQRPGLRTLANDIISAQSKEIEMMSNWRTEWSSR